MFIYLVFKFFDIIYFNCRFSEIIHNNRISPNKSNDHPYNKSLYNKNENKDNNNNKDYKKLNFIDYLIPLFCYRRYKNLKFLDRFIQIYRRKFSLENILEIILKVEKLGNIFEEMKSKENNNIENLEGIYYNENKENNNYNSVIPCRISKVSNSHNFSRNQLIGIRKSFQDLSNLNEI